MSIEITLARKAPARAELVGIGITSDEVGGKPHGLDWDVLEYEAEASNTSVDALLTDVFARTLASAPETPLTIVVSVAAISIDGVINGSTLSAVIVVLAPT